MLGRRLDQGGGFQDLVLGQGAENTVLEIVYYSIIEYIVVYYHILISGLADWDLKCLLFGHSGFVSPVLLRVGIHCFFKVKAEG